MAASAFFVAGLSLRGAVAWYERPFAGLLVDPEGVVSSLALPSWEGMQKGLRYPDRLLEVDGVPLQAAPGHYPSSAWDDAVEKAARDQRSSVRARFATSSGVREVTLEVRPLEPLAWWLYAGGPMLIASLYTMAALIAVSASPRGKLARTFAKVALVAALFLLTLFDYHTTRALVPLFLMAYALVPMGFFVLPMRLPDDVPQLRRWPWIPHLVDGVGWALAGGMLVLLALGETTVGLRDVCAVLFGISLLFFTTSFLVRFVRTKGARRQTLRALLIAMVPPHGVLGLACMSVMLGLPQAILWFAIPALALTPLASLFAFVKYDLWGSRALLSRPLTRLIIVTAMLTFTVTLCVACAPLAGASASVALRVAAPAAMLGAGLVMFALGAGDRKLFPARAEYKPTIEQLSEELTLVSDPGEVARAVERTVRRWLPCENVSFRQVEAEHDDDSAEGAEASGPRAIIARPSLHAGGELVLPVSFHGRALGMLEVGPKAGGALFTSEDLVLLRTIGNLAALAMAHALSYAELEQRRREQAAAWRDERVALIETLAAEITHEVRYPINFFRSIFQRGPHAQTLDAEEVEIGCEEVERLERLVMGLRRVTLRRIERRTRALHDLVSKAEMLLRDQLGKRRVDVRIDGPVYLQCDADQIMQVLVNLLSNGLDAAGECGDVGVSWSAGAAGAELVVWDTGPGVSGDPARIFAPWYTTKPRGTGLGLAITHRLVRAHGWSIGVERGDARTRFVISIPATDIADAALPAEIPEEEVA
ncbi:sensor histidine kinase [Chondromyces crocatus]|uniref:sensor histidine kinase n=1 Tax=Chondromyces crocatus TaxID=52 RepID=UPI001FDED038|nr:ATP-binding protein [Chondromyces crocatus]